MNRTTCIVNHCESAVLEGMLTGDPGPFQYSAFHQYRWEKVPNSGWLWSMSCWKVALAFVGPCRGSRGGNGGRGGSGRRGAAAAASETSDAVSATRDDSEGIVQARAVRRAEHGVVRPRETWRSVPSYTRAVSWLLLRAKSRLILRDLHSTAEWFLSAWI